MLDSTSTDKDSGGMALLSWANKLAELSKITRTKMERFKGLYLGVRTLI